MRCSALNIAMTFNKKHLCGILAQISSRAPAKHQREPFLCQYSRGSLQHRIDIALCLYFQCNTTRLNILTRYTNASCMYLYLNKHFLYLDWNNGSERLSSLIFVLSCQLAFSCSALRWRQSPPCLKISLSKLWSCYVLAKLFKHGQSNDLSFQPPPPLYP